MSTFQKIVDNMASQQPMSRRAWLTQTMAIAASSTALTTLVGCTDIKPKSDAARVSQELPALPVNGDALIEAIKTQHIFADRLQSLPAHISQICQAVTEYSRAAYAQGSVISTSQKELGSVAKSSWHNIATALGREERVTSDAESSVSRFILYELPALVAPYGIMPLLFGLGSVDGKSLAVAAKLFAIEGSEPFEANIWGRIVSSRTYNISALKIDRSGGLDWGPGIKATTAYANVFLHQEFIKSDFEGLQTRIAAQGSATTGTPDRKKNDKGLDGDLPLVIFTLPSDGASLEAQTLELAVKFTCTGLSELSFEDYCNTVKLHEFGHYLSITEPKFERFITPINPVSDAVTNAAVTAVLTEDFAFLTEIAHGPCPLLSLYRIARFAQSRLDPEVNHMPEQTAALYLYMLLADELTAAAVKRKPVLMEQSEETLLSSFQVSLAMQSDTAIREVARRVYQRYKPESKERGQIEQGATIP